MAKNKNTEVLSNAADTTKGNSETITATTPANSAPAAEVISTAVASKKSTVANAIFKEMFAQSPVPQRKDMIARAIKEAGLTQNGAATYLQNFKKANGLVAAKA